MSVYIARLLLTMRGLPASGPVITNHLRRDIGLPELDLQGRALPGWTYR